MALTLTNHLSPDTQDSVRAFVGRWQSRLQQNRYELYDLVQRKAYRLLGYKTAEEFAKRELGVSRRQLQRIVASAAIETDLRLPVGTHLPESHLREFEALTEPEDRRRAYALAKDLVNRTVYFGKAQMIAGKMTATIIRKAVNMIAGKEDQEAIPTHGAAPLAIHWYPQTKRWQVILPGNPIRSFAWTDEQLEAIRQQCQAELDAHEEEPIKPFPCL